MICFLIQWSFLLPGWLYHKKGCLKAKHRCVVAMLTLISCNQGYPKLLTIYFLFHKLNLRNVDVIWNISCFNTIQNIFSKCLKWQESFLLQNSRMSLPASLPSSPSSTAGTNLMRSQGFDVKNWVPGSDSAASLNGRCVDDQPCVLRKKKETWSSLILFFFFFSFLSDKHTHTHAAPWWRNLCFLLQQAVWTGSVS